MVPSSEPTAPPPTAPPPCLEQARALAQQRKFADAERVLLALLGDRPDHAEALNLLGFVLFFQGQFARAEEACRRVLALVPDEPYATLGLGSSLARLGRMQEADASFARAAELRPAWLDVYWDWAVALSNAGRTAEALDVVRRGRAALPARGAEWAKLVAALEARGPQTK